MKWLPVALVLLRFWLGPALLLDARDGTVGAWFAAGLVAALLSDVFDGVLARRLGVATEQLRVADSWVDGWFVCCIGACIWLTHRETVLAFGWLVAAFLFTDWLALGFDWLKFRRVASYHAYSGKLAGLLLFLAAFGLLVWNNSALVAPSLVMGIVAHLERFVITVILPVWMHDVPSAWHAVCLRRKGAL